MSRITLLALACTCVLTVSACTAQQADPAPDATPVSAGAEAAPTPPPASATPAPTPPVDAPAPAPADGGLARFDGYGDMRFGMTAAQATAAWAGDLTRNGAEGETCYHLTPKSSKTPAEFSFMVEDDKFVRYSTESATYVAPGGGKVGMTTAEIEALYPGRIERTPHKYTDGQYLRIKDSANANQAVLFETDKAGMVTEWRAGIAPQVDYVEGCS